MVKVVRLKTQARYRRLARSYYTKGLTVSEIAALHKVARITVLRAVKWARSNDSEVRKLLPIHLKENLDKPKRLPHNIRKLETLTELRSLLSEV